MNEPKKTTLAKTQLGWSGDKTEVSQQPPWGAQQPYAHLLESQPPVVRGSSPQHPHHQVQVHQDYVQQAQGQVKQYDKDPYELLAAQYAHNAQRTNANVQPRRAKGSTPPPRNSERAKPLFNDPTKPHQYNMAAAAASFVMPQQQAQQQQGYAYQQDTQYTPEQLQQYYTQQHAYQQQHASTYQAYVQQADHAVQQAQVAHQQYAQQAYPQQQAHAAAETYSTEQAQQFYAQQAAAQQHAQPAYDAQQYYAQQEQYAAQPDAQQYYAQAQAQQYAAQQQQQAQQPAPDAQQYYAQQQYAAQQEQQQQQQQAQPASDAQQYYAQQQQYAAHYYAQQQADAQPQQHAQPQDMQQYYAQQYAQQVATYEQQQREQQAQTPGNYLGGMAAKLQKRAEKQKAKLEAALKKEGKAGDKREAAIPGAIATADGSARRDFVKRTYKTLFFAILAFAGLLWSFMNIGPLRELLNPFVNFALGGRWNWGIVLAAFMGASIIAERWAASAKSRKVQLMGLGFYVLAEAIIFVPLLAIVEWKTASIVAKGGGDPNIVRDAAFLTLAVFGMLTASVVFSKKDFSFLRSGLWMASGAAMTLIVLSLVFGFNLGLIFSVAMVVLAGGYILYHTSQVLAHYDPEHHVSAALELFSSIALMFWYMIRIFMRARD